MEVQIKRFAVVLASALSMAISGPSLAQTAKSRPETPVAASAPTAVPALVPYSGIAIAADGGPLTGNATMTFLIFKEEKGGEALWMETQSVAVDLSGYYRVQLGASNPNGLPSDLFSTGEARWLEVQIAGQNPQSRILLASVPYAMKAGDAATLGGLPASAYALAGATPAGGLAVPGNSAPQGNSNVETPGGSAGYVPLFTGSNLIADSILFQDSTGVGINTASPAARLDVAGNAMVRGLFSLPATGNANAASGSNSNPIAFNTQAFNSAAQAVIAPSFRWQAEPTGNNTASPGATLNLLYGSAATQIETGFHFNPNGTVAFVSGQTYPGAGTITEVTAGSGLTGGGSSGNVTLKLNTAQVPLLSANNGFTGNEFVTGSINVLSSGYFALQGVSTGPNGDGIDGFAANGNGVYGTTANSGDSGVLGYNSAKTGSGNGVNGESASPSGVGTAGQVTAPTGYGIYGNNMAKTGSAVGVIGISASLSNGATGVTGTAIGATGNTVGVQGNSSSPSGTGVDGLVTAPQGYGVVGNNLAATGSAQGMLGISASSSGTGVSGVANSTTGNTNGVYGTGASPSGTGVRGYIVAPQGFGIVGDNEATTGNAQGVLGVSASTSGSGIAGVATSATGATNGVYGSTVSAGDGAAGVTGSASAATGNVMGVQGFSASSSSGAVGVSGVASATTGSTTGVQGTTASSSSGAIGVSGFALASTGDTTGVLGGSQSPTGTGVLGTNTSGTGGNGVLGLSTTQGTFSTGVQGIAGTGGTGVLGVSPTTGVEGYAEAQCGPPYSCPLTTGIGGQFAAGTGGLILQGLTGATNTNTNQVFYVDSTGSGFFAGNLNVTGKLVKGSGSFKIDDPLDPANKYLSHSFVESPDMMNVYNGNIRTDRSGRATVELPEYFEALNSDFRYQLTVMGQFAQAIVATKIGHNRFVIRTSKPSVEVSWQVTGIRKDAYANANRIPVEENKPAGERGFYLHPEVFNQPSTRGIAAAYQSGGPAKTVAMLPGSPRH